MKMLESVTQRRAKRSICSGDRRAYTYARLHDP